MLFNSIDFAVFLPIVFVLYWYVAQRNLKMQNLLVVVASYLFYGWWDWRFLGLIFASSIIDFVAGLGMLKTTNNQKRKIFLILSITANLGMLGFFKYFDFFVENFVSAFSLFGTKLNVSTLNIILPVGISFYTFQTMSYTIDVYRRKLEPTSDLVAFMAFVSFFPQLVAGPIERATNLLPQFYVKRRFDYGDASDGMRQILWGLFKKIVVADNAGNLANMIFDGYNEFNGSTLALGAFFFAIQIYGDFSGYSDIAIGTSKLFGFKLSRNFNNPYFSRDIAEFWRRWHISLSTWFRDYVYIPLGGSRLSKSKNIRNIVIVFVLSAFWHGANWTFIAWGIMHALYFIPLMLANKNRKHTGEIAPGKLSPKLSDFFKIILTFTLVTFAWVFFRSESISMAFKYLGKIFSATFFEAPYIRSNAIFYSTLFVILVMMAVEWLNRERDFGLDLKSIKSLITRWLFYVIIIILIFWLGFSGQEFIYFQF